MESIRLPLPAKRRRLSSFSSLENQKNLLEVQIREQQTNDAENVREIKKFYEAEMCEARRLLNAQAEESARFDLNYLTRPNSGNLNLKYTQFLRVVQTQAILFWKSMSEKVESDIERLF